jgi:hypothetical protein
MCGVETPDLLLQATTMYLKLVEFGVDRTQQAASLRKCLACFGHDADDAQAAKAAIPRLAHFIESQQVGLLS